MFPVVGYGMSSFQKSVSGKIKHGLAGYRVDVLSASDIGVLDDDARWLLGYTEGRVLAGDTYARRSVLRPGEMKRILPNVLILEPEFSERGRLLDLRVRLMGTSVSWFYGEAGGNSVRGFDDDMATQRALETAALCCGAKEPVIGISFRINHSVPYFPVTVLMIPLAENGHDISHLFAHVAIGAEQK
jgi:hypothetical protein